MSRPYLPLPLPLPLPCPSALVAPIPPPSSVLALVPPALALKLPAALLPGPLAALKLPVPGPLLAFPDAWLRFAAPGPTWAGPLKTLSALTAPAVAACALDRPAFKSELLRSFAERERPRSVPVSRLLTRVSTRPESLLRAVRRLSVPALVVAEAALLPVAVALWLSWLRSALALSA